MRPPRFRTVGVVAALVGTALVLSACSGDSDDTATSGATAPAESGSLVVYSGRDAELIDPLIERFEESSGIDVDVRYSGTTELAAQLLEEGDSTPAHVFLAQDAGALGAVGEADLFSTLPDDITGLVPADFTSTDGSWASPAAPA